MNQIQDETRARLLLAARAIFAEIGFQSATTRQICLAAKANAAAVNYHYGDKKGLYAAVLSSIISEEQIRWDDYALTKLPAELALRSFVAAMFTRLVSREGSDLYAKLMAHEMSQPTESLTMVVEQMIRPRAVALCAIVGKIIGKSADTTQTRLCVHSIIAQIVYHVHSRPVIELLWRDWRTSAKATDELIDHIASFSLAGLHDLARKSDPPAIKKRPRKTKSRVY